MHTNGLWVWVKSADGAYIRADSITVLDVVDGNYRGVTEHERGAHTDSVFLRALVGHQDGESLWYHLTGSLRSRQAFTALRALIFAMEENAAAGVLSHHIGEGWMLERP